MPAQGGRLPLTYTAPRRTVLAPNTAGGIGPADETGGREAHTQAVFFVRKNPVKNS